MQKVKKSKSNKQAESGQTVQELLRDTMPDEGTIKYCLTNWYYAVIRFYNKVIDLPLEVKWFIQRAFRGYSDRDLWGLDYYLGNVIVKSLKAFRSMYRHGMPAIYCQPDKNGKCRVSDKVAMKRWNKDLDAMIEGLEFLANSDDKLTDFFEKYKDCKKGKFSREYDKAYAKAQQQAKLFIDKFNLLWD